ncbi:hypothetical protein M2189_006726 [Bradyrhizobium japonicum]|uniref:hypothetical protein n=1 Tax=Bradyrhizobium japonicum TaxID=375 RepID=UPI002166FC3B|nr:hypothetical protein [Bradyrhizobium japonicum]MCS3503757.1 hypothetical protein [Bradyrhizobium japonicum]MCS3963523.1 hypothetical protein [Bradyrhizobium japonicum]MCS3995836.1 hypothetical protein [Bradyrhizobium japonicum]
MLNANLLAQQRTRGETIATLQKLRREARNEIARLIQFLDQSDPYVMTELEDDDEREPEEAEPSLGSLDRTLDQVRWAMSACDDAEQDNADAEPSLGSLDHNHTQERWAAGGCRDLELDGAESGIGDLDGLLEQVGTQDWQHGGML